MRRNEGGGVGEVNGVGEVRGTVGREVRGNVGRGSRGSSIGEVGEIMEKN